MKKGYLTKNRNKPIRENSKFYTSRNLALFQNSNWQDCGQGKITLIEIDRPNQNRRVLRERRFCSGSVSTLYSVIFYFFQFIARLITVFEFERDSSGSVSPSLTKVIKYI